MDDLLRTPRATTGTTPPYRHVCCCIDDVGDAGPMLAEARRIAGAAARLTVLHVSPPAAVVAGGLTQWGVIDPHDPLAAARLWLRGVAAAAGDGEPVLLSGRPGEEAVSWARAHGVELLVCNARGNGARRRVLGSVAAHLSGHAPCPVLLLGPPDGDAPPREGEAGPFGRVAALSDGSRASLRALEEARRIGGGRAPVVLMVSSRWRTLLARLVGAPAADGADELRAETLAATGAPPRRLRGRRAAALARWARAGDAPLLVVAEETPLGPALRRAAERLAAEGTASVLVARPAAGGAR